MTSTAIMWFRRDLRLADHPALTAAVASHDTVVALFVHDPRLSGVSGANRLAFLHATLDRLDADLGGHLEERIGAPEVVVAEMARTFDAQAVYVTEDFGPYGRRRDDVVRRELERGGCEFRSIGTPYAVAPGTVKTKAGTPYRVFTPFSRAWRRQGWDEPLPVARRGKHPTGARVRQRPSTPRPTATAGLPAAGERAAHDVADSFLETAVSSYDTARDRPDLDQTSRLSPHLKLGTIHPRQLLARLGDQPGPTTFASELCWREFYAEVLAVRPDTVHRNVAPGMDGLRWDTGPEADERFERWCAGQTGYPIVDAGMRQLLAEGWMHNRVRMIVASFLVKDLHVDWRRGAAWFMTHLVDGDLASNTHGWQWTAGTGTDAAPFFRVFNPTAQGRRFDPDGAYVRRYVPELAEISRDDVHTPLVPGDLFAQSSGYPAPIVDHAVERLESLERYQHR